MQFTHLAQMPISEGQTQTGEMVPFRNKEQVDKQSVSRSARVCNGSARPPVENESRLYWIVESGLGLGSELYGARAKERKCGGKERRKDQTEKR